MNSAELVHPFDFKASLIATCKPRVLYNLRVNLRFKLCLAATLLALSTWANSQPVSQLQPTGYVNDFAHVLNSSTVAQMTDICTQIDQKAHAQIAVVTINTL